MLVWLSFLVAITSSHRVGFIHLYEPSGICQNYYFIACTHIPIQVMEHTVYGFREILLGHEYALKAGADAKCVSKQVKDKQGVGRNTEKLVLHQQWMW